ncbi:MAG: hypothetical protein WA182_06295 [Candidatus Sulfotelmatobacter sp.]
MSLLFIIAVLLGALELSYVLWRTRKERTSLSASDHLNVVLLVIAVVSLFVAIAAYKDAAKSGDEQLAALRAARQAITDTGTQQLSTLDDSREALRNVVKTIQQEQNVLDRQLEIEQKRWKKENEKPTVLVMTPLNASYDPRGYVYASIPPSAIISIGRLRRGDAKSQSLSFAVRNVGNGLLKRPRVSVYVEAPAILRCLAYRGNMVTPTDPCESPATELPDLPPSKKHEVSSKLQATNDDLLFFIYFTMPNGSGSARGTRIHITVSGDNLSADTYSMLVSD